VNTPSVQDTPISTLTVAELKSLVADTVRRVIREEMHLETSKTNGENLPPDFLATFGVWEDNRSADEIVADIYANRTLAATDLTL